MELIDKGRSFNVRNNIIHIDNEFDKLIFDLTIDNQPDQMSDALVLRVLDSNTESADLVCLSNSVVPIRITEGVAFWTRIIFLIFSLIQYIHLLPYIHSLNLHC